ncbi:MAG TPA: hypothetical protein VGI71_09590 [Scandinavium sp.]|jgi:hypothetical protein
MQINSEQYRAAKIGHFYSRVIPLADEPVTLVMLTPRGRRRIPVGNVSDIKVLGAAQCLISIDNLASVAGIYT